MHRNVIGLEARQKEKYLSCDLEHLNWVLRNLNKNVWSKEKSFFNRNVTV